MKKLLSGFLLGTALLAGGLQAYTYTAEAEQQTLTGEGGGSDTPKYADKDLISGQAVTLLKGQKGIIEIPADAPLTDELVFQVKVNTTVDLGPKVFYETNSPDEQVNFEKTVEGGYTIYTTRGEMAGDGPWYFMQDVVNVLQVTLFYPNFDGGMSTVAVGTPFKAQAEEKFRFEVPESMYIEITSPTALSRQEWEKMLSATQDFSHNITPSSLNNFADTSGDGSDKTTTCIFRLAATGTYYFQANGAGHYTIAQYKGQTFEFKAVPFNSLSGLISPKEGVETACLWSVQFPNQVLNEEYSPLMSGIYPQGAYIVNPDGYKLKIEKAYIDIVDGGKTYNGVSFSIAEEDYPLAQETGVYTIFIPQGFVYNMGGYPNPETILDYTFKETTVEGEVDYFNINGVSTNIPSPDYPRSSYDLLKVTFHSFMHYTDTDTYSIPMIIDGKSTYGELEDADLLVVHLDTTATTENMRINVRFSNGVLWEDATGKPNPPMSFTINLYAPNQVAALSPEAGSTFYADSDDWNVNVAWDGMINFHGDDDEWYLYTASGTTLKNDEDPLAASGITLKNEDGETIPLFWYVNFDFNEDYTGFVISMEGIEDGTYTLNIPAGALEVVKIDEESFEKIPTFLGFNSEVNATYIVSNENTPIVPVIPDPIGGAIAKEVMTEDGVEGVSITWGDYAIALNEAVDGGVSVTSNIEDVPVVSKAEVVDNALVVTFAEPIMESVTLTVNVVEGCLFVGDEGAVNAEQTMTVIVTVTGVASIGIDGELGQVYTIEGLRVKAQKASELPAGLYIINGKKVVVK